MLLQSALTHLDLDKNLSEFQSNLLRDDGLIPINDNNQTTYDRQNITNNDKVDLGSILNELFSTIPIGLLSFIIAGFVVLPCLLIFCFFFCSKKSSKSKAAIRKLKGKINAIDLNLKLPASTAPLNTSTSSQTHEDTISQVDNDLAVQTLKANQKKRSKNKPKYLFSKEDSQTQSLDNKSPREGNLKSSPGHHISRLQQKKSIKPTIDPNQLVDRLSQTTRPLDNQIEIKKSKTDIDKPEFIKSSNELRRSSPRSRSIHSLRRTKKSRKASDLSFFSRSSSSLNSSVISHDSVPKRASSKSVTRPRSRASTNSKKNRKKRSKNSSRSGSKIRHKKSFKKKKLKSKVNSGNLELKKIQIYDKTIELDKGSNELVSVFKQIPSFSEDKLPSPIVLYSPPSTNTLIKASKPIDLSTSSSEDELIRDYKKFKKSKEKLKTHSNSPVLDDNLLNDVND